MLPAVRGTARTGVPLACKEANWLGATLTYACGTDEQSQRRYREDLAAAGFDVFTTAVDYVASLDIDQLAGVYSAIGSRIPAADQRPAFAEQVRRPSPHTITSASASMSRYWPVPAKSRWRHKEGRYRQL
jgi:hypothetical protein